MSVNAFRLGVLDYFHVSAYGSPQSPTKIVKFEELNTGMKVHCAHSFMDMHLFMQEKPGGIFHYYPTGYSGMPDLDANGNRTIEFKPTTMDKRFRTVLRFVNDFKTLEIRKNKPGESLTILNQNWEGDLSDVLWKGAYAVFAGLTSEAEIFEDEGIEQLCLYEPKMVLEMGWNRLLDEDYERVYGHKPEPLKEPVKKPLLPDERALRDTMWEDVMGRINRAEMSATLQAGMENDDPEGEV